jgi:hypothetical protein
VCRAWEATDDLRAAYKPRTFYRYRRELLERGETIRGATIGEPRTPRRSLYLLVFFEILCPVESA